MADHDYMGKIGRNPTDEIAWRAAERVRHAKQPLAVCIDPDGRVTCERYGEAVPDDVVGVYSRDLGWPALEKQIREDMRHELGLRAAVMGRAA